MAEDDTVSGKPVTSSDGASSSNIKKEGNDNVEKSSRQPAEELLDEQPEPNLLDQAREFLASPAIRHQDANSKREFLLKKGVSSDDAERLLEETDVC